MTISTTQQGPAGQNLSSTEGGWKPIASAPRNKTMLALLYVKGGHSRYGVGWWMPLDGWQGWYGPTFHEEPTHWMPLPEPPAA